MDRAAHHQVLPFWRGVIGHPEKDAFWSGGDATPALERLEIPVLLAGGWYDPFLSSTLLGFTGPDGVWNASGPERARRLVVGPWRHGGNGSSKTGEVDFGPQAAVDLDAMNLRFAAHVLGGERGDAGLPAPLRIFVMGENRWRDEREWPLARAKPTPLSRERWHANTLDGDGLLSWTQSASAPPDRFVYDPLDPVPTRGGNLPGATPDEPPGPFDQREIETRKDVLVYTSEPLREPLEVTGPLEVVLWAASDARDTDFTAKLVDVAPDGTAINLADGAVRARYRDSVTAPTPDRARRRLPLPHRPGRHQQRVPAGPPGASRDLLQQLPALRPQPEHRRAARPRDRDAAGGADRLPRRRAAVAHRAAGGAAGGA